MSLWLCTAAGICGEERSVEELLLKHAARGNLLRLVATLNREDCPRQFVNSVRNDEGRTALHLAALGGHKECLKVLLRRRANPNIQDNDGFTPSHFLILGGAPARFPLTDVVTTRNPFLGTYLCLRGTYNFAVYHLKDRRVYKRCLQYLVYCGADLGIQSIERETARDIAVRLRKMALLEVIEDAYDLRVSDSGWHIENGSSILRRSQSYPPACPKWMHRETSSTSLINKSPLTSNASLHYRGRGMTVYDYGFVFPFGSDTSPGARAGVPVILPTEITSSREWRAAGDGSRWRMALWQGQEVTVREHHSRSKFFSPELLVLEMESLSHLRHPNILLLMATCCGPSKPDMMLITELVQPLSLFQLLHHSGSNQSIMLAKRLSIALGITQALCYLHNVVSVTHTIISSHSVYLTRDLRPKLCNVYRCCQPSTKISQSVTFLPFLHWMAPEFFHVHISSFAADVYSLGAVLWEMWSGEEPWAGLYGHQLQQTLLEEKKSLPLGEEHREFAPILQKIFSTQPEHRPTVKQVLAEFEQLYP